MEFSLSLPTRRRGYIDARHGPLAGTPGILASQFPPEIHAMPPRAARSRGRAEHAPVALVTGASSGIGAELARAFGRRGYDLVLLARDRARLDALARDLQIEGRAPPIVMTADLSHPGAPERVFADLQRRGLVIDVLVNNAGIMCEGDFVETDLDDLLRLLQTNVVALTALTRVFAPAMKARRAGRILNVASIAAFAPAPRIAVYAAGKAYVLSLSEALAEELADSGVTVTALCPGFTETGMLERSHVGQSLPDAIVMSASAVAEQGCAACLSGERVCTPGFVNLLTTMGMRWAPRPIVRYLGGLGRRLAASQNASAEEAKPQPTEQEVGVAPTKRPDGKPRSRR